MVTRRKSFTGISHRFRDTSSSARVLNRLDRYFLSIRYRFNHQAKWARIKGMHFACLYVTCRARLYLSYALMAYHITWFNHGPINHGLATPFLSYRVTLNARKTRDFIRDLIIWQSYKLGPSANARIRR